MNIIHKEFDVKNEYLTVLFHTGKGIPIRTSNLAIGHFKK